MNYSITTSSYFDVAAKKLAKKYSSFKDDLVNFGKSLLENPKQGTELAPGIRKIRMAIKSKGKGKSGVPGSSLTILLHMKWMERLFFCSFMTRKMLLQQRSMSSKTLLRKKAILFYEPNKVYSMILTFAVCFTTKTSGCI